MRFLKSLLAATGLLFGSFLAATAGLAVFGGPSQTNPIPCCENTIPAFNGLINSLNGLVNLGSANTAIGPALNPTGRVYSQTGTVQALATNQGLTIATYTIPANAFDLGGRTLRIHAEWHTASNINSKAYACGVAGAQVTKTLTTDIGSPGFCDFVVTQGPTANTQMFTGHISVGTTPSITNLAGTTTGSFTTAGSAQAYFSVGTPTAAGDVQLDNFEIWYDN